VPKYVIRRYIPAAGMLSAPELNAISQKSCGILSKMGPQNQWLQSYGTGGKVFGVHIALEVFRPRRRGRKSPD
jgi:hypothetical protein